MTRFKPAIFHQVSHVIGSLENLHNVTIMNDWQNKYTLFPRLEHMSLLHGQCWQ